MELRALIATPSSFLPKNSITDKFAFDSQQYTTEQIANTVKESYVIPGLNSVPDDKCQSNQMLMVTTT